MILRRRVDAGDLTYRAALGLSRGAIHRFSDWRTGELTEWVAEHGRRFSGAGLGGHANPDWIEWLMGWPIGWTGTRPLETAKFRRWLRSHGRC
tara:strand:- start:892 stop:1170 length:279 start_codon:yes stop_codon:yes gene_type:complete